MEPILQFPQGSKNSNTVCLFQIYLPFEMGNLKITLNHRKSEFSNHEIAYKVIKYHCVVISCSVARKHKFSNFSTSLYSSLTQKIKNQVKLTARAGEIPILQKSAALLS